ncbi:MAG: hypothetical protein IKE37_02760, partial [Firmicutes bacterium]|nr:hypothetical protein [Bacillota bacterium]
MGAEFPGPDDRAYGGHAEAGAVDHYAETHREGLPGGELILNVIDASNLERNLYLTTQLIAMNIKMVVALNMFDE